MSAPLTGSGMKTISLTPAAAPPAAGWKAVGSALPADLTVDGLLAWLSTKMRDADGDIRARMDAMTSAKNREKQFDQVLSSLENAQKKDKLPDGSVAMDPPLDDPAAFRESDFYKSLDSDARKAIDEVLNGVQPPALVVTCDDLTTHAGSGSERHWNKGAVINADDAAYWSVTAATDGVTAVPGRMNKDALDKTVASLKDAITSIGSNDEVEMINLQAKISAAGQLSQLVSNMLATSHDTAKTIIGNTRG